MTVDTARSLWCQDQLATDDTVTLDVAPTYLTLKRLTNCFDVVEYCKSTCCGVVRSYVRPRVLFDVPTLEVNGYTVGMPTSATVNPLAKPFG